MHVPRVLIIVQNLPVPSDRRVWLEAGALREAGYKVSVISPSGKRGRERLRRDYLDGIHLYRYAQPPPTSGTLSFLFEFIYCWLQTLRLSLLVWLREGFDVIHACNPPETFFLIGWFYGLFGKRFIFDHHDLSPEMYAARFGKKGIAHRGLLMLERLTFRTADVVISTNETHRRVALERGGVDPKRVVIVRSGPDPDVLCPVPPNLSLKEDSQYLVAYLGVINPQDGVDLLVKVVDVIVNQQGRSDVLFVVMGDGDALNDLREMSAQHGLEAFIRFTGWVEQEKAGEVLSTADVCVDTIPKTDYSNSCTMNKILEYMSVGRPIVAFDLDESRISAGGAALYAAPNDVRDFADKVLRLLDDKVQRVRMGRLGRDRIESTLSWLHQKKNLLRAYEMVVARPEKDTRG